MAHHDSSGRNSRPHIQGRRRGHRERHGGRSQWEYERTRDGDARRDRRNAMSTVVIQRPASSEYAPAYSGYVSAVPDGDVLELLEKQGRETQAMLRGINEKK